MNAANNAELSLVASIISTACKIVQMRTGLYPDRNMVGGKMRQLLDSIADEKPDKNDWANSPIPGMYDVYLELRTEQGTVTGYDMIRPGMVSTDFSTGAEFVKHNARVHAHRTQPDDLWNTKTCSRCGIDKPRDKFPKKGGSKCKACVGANSRDRKDAAIRAEKEDENAV